MRRYADSPFCKVRAKLPGRQLKTCVNARTFRMIESIFIFEGRVVAFNQFGGIGLWPHDGMSPSTER